MVIGAGGTAGHVFPALATATSLRDRLGAEVRFVGREDGQEAALVPAAGFPLDTVEALPFTRTLSGQPIRAALVALRAAGRSREFMRDVDVVLGMGGYVSVPVSLAARKERVPLVLHEQNAAPGLANRVAARWAAAVAVSFPDAAGRFPRRVRTVVTGNPVRAAIARVPRDREDLRREGTAALDLDPQRRTVVVFGGSQGARRINRAAALAARAVVGRGDLQLVVLTGPARHAEVTAAVAGTPHVRAVPFLERMELAYAAAELVVCRAGATTVAELTVCGLPAILVPYPHATGKHQEANARSVAGAGGAEVLADEQVTPQALADGILSLTAEPGRLASMRRSSAAIGRPHAADALADLTVAVARAGGGR